MHLVCGGAASTPRPDVYKRQDYVPPLEQATGEAAALPPAGAVSAVRRYDLSQTIAADGTTSQAEDVLADYLLLYAPRGWSGPVVVFRLDTPN